MLKTFLSLLISLLVLAACSPEKRNDIELFNQHYFRLKGKEKEINIVPSIQEAFATCCNNNSFQIPLYKVIRGNNYSLFIGIPLKTSINGLTAERISHFSDSTSGIISGTRNENSGSYFGIYQAKEGYFIAEYADKLDSNSFFYVAVISSSQGVADSLFNEEELSGRFYSKKQHN